MPTRTARTAWNGTCRTAPARSSFFQLQAGTFDVSFPSVPPRTPTGRPARELIAAAHGSCYSMQLSAVIAEAGGTPQSLDVTVDVDLGQDPPVASGSPASRSPCAARSRASTRPASSRPPDAEVDLPVSKALTGVEISLDAALES